MLLSQSHAAADVVVSLNLLVTALRQVLLYHNLLQGHGQRSDIFGCRGGIKPGVLGISVAIGEVLE